MRTSHMGQMKVMQAKEHNRADVMTTEAFVTRRTAVVQIARDVIIGPQGLVISAIWLIMGGNMM